jgi:hypothetical protein
MKDFFISYNGEDSQWAKWIAWQLEEAGFSTFMQAWDSVGNWVIRMNEAMREARRTIAVLSPNYVKSPYTQAEWANAFRLDPIGERDLLIPVRVQPVSLEGALAQFAYVDLVNVDEDAAVELLLNRVSGQRGKPSVRPAFPSPESGTKHFVRRASATSKPVYPAFDEDTKRLIRAREIFVDWRVRYHGQEVALGVAAEKAREWSEPRGWRESLPAEFDDEVAEVVDLAARAASDLRSLSLNDLKFARAYGLMVHPTVFWGQATESVAWTHRSYGSGRSEARKRLMEAMITRGRPDRYAFEMVARVLESAHELLTFRLDSLPRGYIEAGPVPPDDLRSYYTLFVASIDDDPRLHLIAVDQTPMTLGTFAARKLTAYPLCARRNSDGSIDIVAEDDHFVYRWCRSSQKPSMQYPHENLILHASFLSSAPEAGVVTIETDGKVRLLGSEGRVDEVPTCRANSDFHSATFWIDPLNREQWRALALTKDGELVSQSLSGPNTGLTAEFLWQDASFPKAPRLGIPSPTAPWQGICWRDNFALAVHEFDGFPCLVVRRQAEEGEGVVFLDPLSLHPLRQPLFITEFVGDMIIVAGRWLAVFFLQSGRDILPRIALWDLRTSGREPIARCFEREGDVYHPVVTKEGEDSFEVVFVLRQFGSSHGSWLCRFRWPSGTVEEFEKHTRLRIIPVS